jgi:hypothetical protein
MANTHTTLTSLFADVANAIRAKTGDSGTIVADNFPTAIAAIPTGGGSVSPSDVNFYDYDGTLVKSYTLAEAQALTALPDAPDHSSDAVPLTFQGWNWTLAQVKALTQKQDVGATYITTDGKTHLLINIAALGRMTLLLYISQTVSAGVTIDWGDGSATRTIYGTGNVITSHTYAAIGSYDITLTVASGCTLGFGSGNGANNIFGSNPVYRNMLQDVRIGSGVTSISDYAFFQCYSLASVTIPSGVTSIGNYVFQSCYSLASVTIPSGVTSISNYVFHSCYSLANVTIPSGVTSISDYYAFFQCYSLASVTIPSGVTSIGYGVIQSCYSLASITIPSGVTSISNYAFQSCYSLANVTIPSGVTSIGNGAFYQCTGMAEYHLLPTTPPTLASTNVFNSIPSDCKIYVPSASLSAYQSATNWSTYASYMVGE